MPENTKLYLAQCPKFRHKCRLFQRDIGVVVYLFLLAGYDEKEKIDEETTPEQTENAFLSDIGL